MDPYRLEELSNKASEDSEDLGFKISPWHIARYRRKVSKGLEIRFMVTCLFVLFHNKTAKAMEFSNSISSLPPSHNRERKLKVTEAC